jgi:hypothetical protein
VKPLWVFLCRVRGRLTLERHAGRHAGEKQAGALAVEELSVDKLSERVRGRLTLEKQEGRLAWGRLCTPCVFVVPVDSCLSNMAKSIDDLHVSDIVPVCSSGT